MKRVHVFYSGRVQGVGFRYATGRIATDLNAAHRSLEQRITGWVRNLGDGRVELVAESEEAVLKEFLESIKQEFGSDIHNAEIEWSDGTDEFAGFTIASTV